MHAVTAVGRSGLVEIQLSADPAESYKLHVGPPVGVSICSLCGGSGVDVTPEELLDMIALLRTSPEAIAALKTRALRGWFDIENARRNIGGVVDFAGETRASLPAIEVRMLVDALVEVERAAERALGGNEGLGSWWV